MEHKTKTTIKLPLIIAIGSFIIFTLVASLSNPQQSIVFIPLFFIFLWLVVFGAIWTISRIFFRGGRPKLRTYSALFSTAVTVYLMLKSTGEIRLIDAVVLVLLISGLTFYINRRY